MGFFVIRMGLGDRSPLKRLGHHAIRAIGDFYSSSVLPSIENANYEDASLNMSRIACDLGGATISYLLPVYGNVILSGNDLAIAIAAERTCGGCFCVTARGLASELERARLGDDSGLSVAKEAFEKHLFLVQEPADFNMAKSED